MSAIVSLIIVVVLFLVAFLGAQATGGKDTLERLPKNLKQPSCTGRFSRIYEGIGRDFCPRATAYEPG